MKTLAIAAVVVALASAAHARPRPIDYMFPITVDPANLEPTISNNIIYLNNCQPNGCTLRPGSTDSRTDTSELVQSEGVLTPFADDDATWNAVVSCMQDVFYPYNIQITTTDPGSSPHFEIMIAGEPTDIGLPDTYGGVSPYACGVSGGYIPNALVFDFSKVWGGNVEDLCSTAAQEIAHSFTLDHADDPMDPMTYFTSFTGRKYFTSSSQCGSDCVNSKSPQGPGVGGYTCTGAAPGMGTSGPQIHPCVCTGQSTQDENSKWTTLFGASSMAGPTVAITKPLDGEAVTAGFAVDATAMNTIGVTKAELYIDGTLASTITTTPYIFNAPATLGPGTHAVKVTAYDHYGDTGSAQINAIIGTPCKSASDCMNSSDVCIAGRCLLGPGQPRGLGATCMNGPDCDSGQCTSDGTNSYCATPCDLGQGECPSGFGCLANGSSGVCWPGYNDGSSKGGGCQSGGDTTFLGLGFALLFLRRRKK